MLASMGFHLIKFQTFDLSAQKKGNTILSKLVGSCLLPWRDKIFFILICIFPFSFVFLESAVFKSHFVHLSHVLDNHKSCQTQNFKKKKFYHV